MGGRDQAGRHRAAVTSLGCGRPPRPQSRARQFKPGLDWANAAAAQKEPAVWRGPGPRKLLVVRVPAPIRHSPNAWRWRSVHHTRSPRGTGDGPQLDAQICDCCLRADDCAQGAGVASARTTGKISLCLNEIGRVWRDLQFRGQTEIVRWRERPQREVDSTASLRSA
jgi:hypothetical protein